MFYLRSNQYIPARPERLPSGMPKCKTYYYFVNEQNQVIDKRTLKPYRGKQIDRYAMHSETEAKAYLEVINKEYSVIEYSLNGSQWLRAFHIETVGGVLGKVELLDIATGNKIIVNANQTRMIVNIVRG